MAITRGGVLALLGGEVGARRFVTCDVVQAGAVQSLSFTADTGDVVPGYYIAPKGPGPAPALLYCHAYGGRYAIGREGLVAGRPALIGPYADALARAEYGVLCLEMPCFGARADMDENATAKARLWQGRTLFGQMLAEQVAGLAAPRRVLHCVGLQDWSTPPAAFATARADVQSAWGAAGAPGAVEFHDEQDSGHAETPAMRARVMEFLEKSLCPDPVLKN